MACKRYQRQHPGRGVGLFPVNTRVETPSGAVEIARGVDRGTRFLRQFDTY